MLTDGNSRPKRMTQRTISTMMMLPELGIELDSSEETLRCTRLKMVSLLRFPGLRTTSLLSSSSLSSNYHRCGW